MRISDWSTDVCSSDLVADGIVDDVAADFGHLEPLEVPQRLRGGADGVADRVVERVGRGAVDLGDGIDVARHGAVPPLPVFPTATAARRAGSRPPSPCYLRGAGRDGRQRGTLPEIGRAHV